MLRELGPFHLPGLPPARKVRAYVPSGLRGRSGRPALFLFDGQNVFDDGPSFSGGWHAHEVAERLSARGLRVPVLIGVDHGGERRISELSPWSHGPFEGRADALLDWIAATLVPLCRQRLRLAEGPEDIAIGGSSMGGLAALYAHYRHPEVFGAAMAMSPSLWLAGGRLSGYLAERPRPPGSRIYLDCGGREAKGRMLALSERLARQLVRQGYGDGELKWRPEQRGSHNERAWRRRLPGALRFLFPGARGRTPGAPRPG